MSATIDLDFFISYFNKENIEPNVIRIEGRTGVVDRFFLEDICTLPDIDHYVREKLKSREREQYLCQTLDEVVKSSNDFGSPQKETNTQAHFNADVDVILNQISSHIIRLGLHMSICYEI